jgi:RNA polymerase sigma factor (sigma-70 family)
MIRVSVGHAPIEEARVLERFDDVYGAERMRLVRLALLLTGSDAAAEDLVQDAAVRVQARWSDVAEPRAYLRAAVVNASRSWVRHQAIARRLPLASEAVLDDRSVELWDALARLRERSRTALVLRYWGGLTTIEIAEHLGCAPGTVGSLLHRGLAELREVLNDEI